MVVQIFSDPEPILDVFTGPISPKDLSEYNLNDQNKTAILSFRVKYTTSRGDLEAPCNNATYHRSTYLAPLGMLTQPYHDNEARDQIGRMLNTLQLPRNDTEFDFVARIVEEIRRVAQMPRLLPNVVDVKIFIYVSVLCLPPYPPMNKYFGYLDGEECVDFSKYVERDEDYYIRRQLDSRRITFQNMFLLPGILKSGEVARKRLETKEAVVEEGESCSVCMDEMLDGSETTWLPCAHQFHGKCIAKWVETNKFCPLCRFQLPS